MEQGAIRILKSASDVILARTGAKPEAWPWIYNYIADINNHCASKILNWKTPIEKRHGYTPDISAFLLYQFWEPIYYLVDEKTPNSKERKGHWMGVSHNVGDKLTHTIFTVMIPIKSYPVVLFVLLIHQRGLLLIKDWTHILQILTNLPLLPIFKIQGRLLMMTLMSLL